MLKVEEYKRHADQCRKMASSASDQEARERLLQMAETWDALARDREEELARRQRLFNLEKQQS